MNRYESDRGRAHNIRAIHYVAAGGPSIRPL